MDFSVRKKRGGIDDGLSRKKREEKSLQIRKDRRLDRANLQRRRYQYEEEEEESKKQSKARQAIRRNLDALPQKSLNLYSENVNEMLDAATYFRKVLASDKCPPVDLVVESGVVPRLVQLLSRHDLPSLQLEASWAITNIACAEVRHARLLINNGVLPLLIELIANSRDDSVREQSLWALGNISADINDCRDLLLEAGILAPLLWQLGIESPPHRISISPSLFTMRHVTWTCSNLIRGHPPPPLKTFKTIIYAFAELLHSPSTSQQDEELLNDACAALVIICDVSSDNIQLVMEQGIFSRLKELCEVTSVRESAVLVLCSILRSTECCQSKVLLSSRFSGTLRSVVNEIKTANSDKTRIEIFQTLRSLFDVDCKYIAKCLTLGLLDAICSSLDRNIYHVSTQGGYCLCVIATECSQEDATVVLSQGFPYLCNLLSSTEQNLLVAALLGITRALKLASSAAKQETQAISPEMESLKGLLHNSDVIDRVGLLASHPSSDIAGHAAQLEGLLTQFTDDQEI